jgi:hypothetical protein
MDSRMRIASKTAAYTATAGHQLYLVFAPFQSIRSCSQPELELKFGQFAYNQLSPELESFHFASPKSEQLELKRSRSCISTDRCRSVTRDAAATAPPCSAQSHFELIFRSEQPGYWGPYHTKSEPSAASECQCCSQETCHPVYGWISFSSRDGTYPSPPLSPSLRIVLNGLYRTPFQLLNIPRHNAGHRLPLLHSV